MKIIKENITPLFQPSVALAAPGQDITVNGSVYKIRAMGSFSFIILRTGRHLIQCVYDAGSCDFDIAGLHEGDCIEASGIAAVEERAENGFEIRLKSIKVLSVPHGQAPVCISKKRLNMSLDMSLAFRPFILRNQAQRAVFKIQEGVVSGFRNHMLKMGFTEIHSPKIVKAGAEGGANIFKLDYFGEKAYLAQSPQFYKQTMAAVFDRVFEIAPVYRAERHNTSRHLNEYIGLDFEMAYIKDMYDVMAMETGMLKAVIEELENGYSYELELLGAKLPKIQSIPSMTFREVKDTLKQIEKAAKNRYDLEPEEEQAICDYAEKELGSEFIFITHYPSSQRPFYAMDDPDDPDYALSFDLLFRGLEITTGGQRIHDYAEQVEKMKRYDLCPDDFDSYLMIHKYGMPPHGGLGIGLERLVMKLLNLQNIRQASLFPRDMARLVP